MMHEGQRERPTSRDQLRPLVRTFLARFFENEITGGTNDLKASFFWLLSFLAMPGVFMPAMMSFSWTTMSLFGAHALRVMSQADKVLYLDFSMIATAVVSAIVWNSLLIDRRDALVLGALPVRPATIVRAKLIALSIYVGLISVAMHACASIVWGLLLATGSTMTFALRGMAAHFVASCAASIFILVSIAGVQGLVLAVTGPRLFARVSPLLQLALVLAIGLAVFTLPGITSAVVDTLKIASHSGELIPLAKLSALARDVGPPNYRPWILNTPPLWFLGLYEWLLGGPGPLLAGFARTALVALASAVGVTIAAYSIAYRRVLVTMVEEAAGFGRVGRSARAIAWLSAIIARRPRQRAIAQFFLTTIARGDRQRFAMAISLGAAVALSLPTAVHWVALWPHPPQRPEVDLLTLPMVMTFVVLVGMRVAASLPSDLKAAWLFDVLAPRPSDVRAVMERAMFILVVLPAIVVFLPIHWRLWGARVGLTHVVLALGIGFFQIQLLLSRAGGMPCTQGWRPERAKLRTWWPWYFLGFLWFATGMRLESRSAGSALEMLLLQVPPVGSVFLIIFLIAGAVLRRRSMARLADPVDVLEPSGVVEILSLNQR